MEIKFNLMCIFTTCAENLAIATAKLGGESLQTIKLSRLRLHDDGATSTASIHMHTQNRKKLNNMYTS